MYKLKSSWTLNPYECFNGAYGKELFVCFILTSTVHRKKTAKLRGFDKDFNSNCLSVERCITSEILKQLKNQVEERISTTEQN